MQLNNFLNNKKMTKELNQKLKSFKIVSVITFLIGAVLMIYMIKVEDEPGALPLFLILIGTIGFVVSEIKIKKQRNA